MNRDPRAAPANNIAGVRPAIVESPLGPSVGLVADRVFGGPQLLKQLTGDEAGRLGRQLVNLSNQIAQREPHGPPAQG
jgi:hypothetical protein